MAEYLGTVLVFGLACGTFSATVSQSRLFKPLRDRVERHWAWGGDLVSCPYCLGHWASGMVVLVLLSYPSVSWVIVTWLAVTGVAAVTSGVISRLHGE